MAEIRMASRVTNLPLYIVRELDKTYTVNDCNGIRLAWNIPTRKQANEQMERLEAGR